MPVDSVDSMMQAGLFTNLPPPQEGVNYFERYSKISLANLVIEQQIKKLSEKNKTLKHRIKTFEFESADSDLKRKSLLKDFSLEDVSNHSDNAGSDTMIEP